MDADERDICEYLKSWPGQFIAAREIARRAGGKWRFRDDPEWAMPVITRLVEKGLLESDSTGHYRLVSKPKGDRKGRKWVSPHIKKILQNSGKDFGEATRIEEDDSL
jgi:hypothetical protein